MKTIRQEEDSKPAVVAACDYQPGRFGERDAGDGYNPALMDSNSRIV